MRQKDSLISVLEREGMLLKRRGRRYWALCPFHEEKTPSFMADPQKQRWWCFGCNLGGDVFDFIQRRHNINFRGALRILGINGEGKKSDPVSAMKKKLLRDFREWESKYKTKLCDRLRLCRQIIDRGGPEGLDKTWMVVDAMTDIQCEIDILENGDDEVKFYLFCEVERPHERF